MWYCCVSLCVVSIHLNAVCLYLSGEDTFLPYARIFDTDTHVVSTASAVAGDNFIERRGHLIGDVQRLLFVGTGARRLAPEEPLHPLHIARDADLVTGRRYRWCVSQCITWREVDSVVAFSAATVLAKECAVYSGYGRRNECRNRDGDSASLHDVFHRAHAQACMHNVASISKSPIAGLRLSILSRRFELHACMHGARSSPDTWRAW